MYIEASSPQRRGDIATLKYTFPFPTNSKGCLSLFYNMYGRSIGSLQVATQNGNVTNVQWSLEGNQGYKWHPVIISIPEETSVVCQV